MDDDGLMAAIAAGDHVALREVFTRHAPWLAARLRRLLPADAVEDVLQETFIAVWRGARNYHADGRLGAWLWGVARRQAALWLRRNGQPVSVPEAAAPGDPAAIAISNTELEQAFATLGPAGSEQQELVRLMFVEERPLAAIAAHFGIPVGTVKSRVYKARRLLQAALRQGGHQ